MARVALSTHTVPAQRTPLTPRMFAVQFPASVRLEVQTLNPVAV